MKFGRSSVDHVEVLQGLQPGDQVVLSDMSAWDAHDRVRLDLSTFHVSITAASRDAIPLRGRRWLNPAAPLITLDNLKKVFYTDEVETHALAGIHLEI